jgi:hypothetical protein
VQILGVDLGAFLQLNPELGRHVMVAEANDGFLPEVASSRLVQKKGEIVHLEVQATLLKDVTVRQSHGGYSGFSFPIGKTASAITSADTAATAWRAGPSGCRPTMASSSSPPGPG